MVSGPGVIGWNIKREHSSTVIVVCYPAAMNLNDLAAGYKPDAVPFPFGSEALDKQQFFFVFDNAGAIILDLDPYSFLRSG